MKISDLLRESMSIYPVIYDGKAKGHAFVFPKEIYDKFDYANFKDDGFNVPPENPKYRSDLDLTLSNSNMEDILYELGFGNDDGSYSIPIDMFIEKCHQWLKQHINKPSGGNDAEIETGEGGATLISGGRNDNYFNQVIMKMLMIAKEGKKLGATHLSIA